MAADSLAFILQIMLENILLLPLLPTLFHSYSLFRCQSKSHFTLLWKFYRFPVRDAVIMKVYVIVCLFPSDSKLGEVQEPSLPCPRRHQMPGAILTSDV